MNVAGRFANSFAKNSNASSGGSGGSGDLSREYASNRGSNPYSGSSVWQQTPGYGGTSLQGNSIASGKFDASTGKVQWQSDSGRQRGAVGGAWGSAGMSGSGSSLVQGNSASSSVEQAGAMGAAAGAGPIVGHVGAAASDGEYERGLVLELCAPGGTRAVPPKDLLDRFTDLSVNLNPELIVPVLLDQLSGEGGGGWQVKCKALAVMAALAKADGCEAHLELMRESVDEVASLSNAKPVTLAAKAKKLVKELGGGGGGSNGTATAAAAQSIELLGDSSVASAKGTPSAVVNSVPGTATAAGDLLGMDFLPSTPADTAAPAVLPSAPVTAATTTAAAPPAPPQPLSNDLLNGAHQPSENSMVDMLGDLSLGSPAGAALPAAATMNAATAVAPTPTSAAMANPTASIGLMNPTNSANASFALEQVPSMLSPQQMQRASAVTGGSFPPGASPAVANVDMLGEAVGGSIDAEYAAMSPGSAGAVEDSLEKEGSAFSFLNSDGGETTETTAVRQALPTARTPQQPPSPQQPMGQPVQMLQQQQQQMMQQTTPQVIQQTTQMQMQPQQMAPMTMQQQMMMMQQFQQNQMQLQQMQQMMQQMQAGNAPMQMPNMVNPQQRQMTPMATGMMMTSARGKTIPDQSQSGFGFMGGGGASGMSNTGNGATGGLSQQHDAFSFVKDDMRSK